MPETCIAIASCKMFIGSLSAYLTIAHAVHDVPHIIGLSDCQDEINRMSNLQTYICSIIDWSVGKQLKVLSIEIFKGVNNLFI